MASKPIVEKGITVLSSVLALWTYRTGSYLPSLIAAGVSIMYFVVAPKMGWIASDTAVKRELVCPLNKTTWSYFPLIKVTTLSPNTAIYRFGMDQPWRSLNLPIGQHLTVGAEINGKPLSRSYTPVSANWDRGYFDLLIKTYPQGNVSRYVRDMKIGDKLQVKGPKGQFVYRPNRVRVFGMIAGGTGITPMYQIMRAVLNNPEDRSTIQLIFANVALEDILLKDELDALAKEHPDRVKVTYCLNTPPTPAENNGHPWEGYTGFVTEEMIRKHLPAPASDIQILMCGPPPMMKAMCAHTDAIGYDKPQAISKPDDMVFKF